MCAPAPTPGVGQVFDNPATAATTPRVCAVANFAEGVTRRPHTLGTQDIAPLCEACMSDEDIIDLLHTVATFGWVTRLMHNLGEPVQPD